MMPKTDCEFVHPHPHEWHCTTHNVTKIAGTSEPNSCDWSGSQCSVTPDACWVDDVTGEHVNAYTCVRTAQHPLRNSGEVDTL